MSPSLAKPEFPPPKHPAGYTYEEIAGFWGVAPVTASRWFRDYDKEHPTKRTVRISPATLADFRNKSRIVKQTRRLKPKKKTP